MTATKTTAAAPAPEPVADVTMGEITESLTGYDEIAIEQQMNLTFVELAAAKHSMKWARAHVAFYLVRKGEKNAAAWKTAMSMTQKELQTFFPKASADLNDVLDGSDEGKGDGTPAQSPTRKPRSVSSPE